MNAVKSTVIAAAAALAIAACTPVPIYNVSDAPIATTSGKHLQASQVRSAIMTAGTSLGWHIVDAGPGRLEGTLNLRNHTAVVDIPYSASKYSIVFKRAENLEAGEGKIHKNYNGWVQNLDHQIRAEISRL